MVRSDDPYIMALTSFDGGKSWSKQKMNNIGGDPWTLITNTGTVLMAGLGSEGTLLIYRSEDGGRTWEEPQNLGK